MSLQRDLAWQSNYLPRIQDILASSLSRRLFRVASLDEDQNRNTDMMTLFAGEVRVACRVRRPAVAERYRGEFTIRDSRPSGATTELQKLIDGWGNYIFYGVAHPTEHGQLKRWLLGDLFVFRRYISECQMRNGGQLPGAVLANQDGTTFRAYRVGDLPSPFVVAMSGQSVSHEGVA